MRRFRWRRVVAVAAFAILAVVVIVTSAESLALLPADTPVVEIIGGNHANFGSYEGQPSDPVATIPREEQQVRAVTETIALLESISAGD